MQAAGTRANLVLGIALPVLGLAMLNGLLPRVNPLLPGILILVGAILVGRATRAMQPLGRPHASFGSYLAAGALAGAGLAVFVASFVVPTWFAVRWLAALAGLVGLFALARVVKAVRRPQQ